MQYTGTKAEIVGDLRGQARDRRKLAKSMQADGKAGAIGFAEGLEHAARMLEQWQPADPAPVTESSIVRAFGGEPQQHAG